MPDHSPAPGAISRALFLSYARDDAEAARRIADALRAFGVEVWFDQNELRGGDAWDAKIKQQIRECTLFVAIISATTQARDEGYFRREWKLAVERTHDMAARVAFLLPIVIDETAESDAIVPDEFMRVQWTRLPHGVPSPEFVQQVKRLLEAPKAVPAANRHRAQEAGKNPAVSNPPQRKRTWVFPAAIVVAAAVGACVWLFRRDAAAVPASPKAGLTAEAPAKPEAPGSAPLSPTKIDSKSIAILPFANMSEDKDTGFFADGVHEDLLTNLALVPELKVVSRTSVMQYRGTTKTMKQIGGELGIAYVLEGSVRRSGNRVRVTGQLINTRTDEHVWAKSYDRDLTDVFSIQAELSKEIASALSAAISPQTEKFLERRPTENPVAYDDFLRARNLRNTTPAASLTALREIEALFKNAVRQDPAFAAAWGELGVVHALYSFWGLDGSAARLAEADAAIAQAVRLAPDDPAVIESAGTYAYYAHRDYGRATEQYEKLARLRPNDATVISSLGLIQRRQGRWVDSLANLRRAVELDPANVGYVRNLGDSLANGRRWDDLRVVHERLIAIAPNRFREQLDAVDAEFVATGSLKAADELLARLTPAQREMPVTILYRKYWAMNRGDYAEFKKLDQLLPVFEDEELPLLSAVVAGGVYRTIGDTAALEARIGPALAEARAQTVRDPTNAVAWSFCASFEALAGHADEALRLAKKAAEMMPESRDALDGPRYRYVLALVYARNGDREHAIQELSHVLSVPGTFSVANIRASPGFVMLHGDPQFESLLNDPKNNAPLF